MVWLYVLFHAAMGRDESAETRLIVEGIAAGALPAARCRNWHFYSRNPILTAHGDLEMQAGEGNVYAPDVHRTDDGYLMWYGGQGRDGHDRIHLARSEDGLRWTRIDENPVIDVDGSNHVNDPTVVRVDGAYHMFYSEAPVLEEDVIRWATSADGIDWEPHGSVIPFGPPGSWDSFKVGRPSVIHEEGLFKMWYDGTNSSPEYRGRIGDPARRHVGYATSTDGRRWRKHDENPVVFDAGAIDVKRVGDTYVLLAESGHGTRSYTSPDGVDWEDQGWLFGTSGEEYDRAGQVTPMAYVEGGAWVAVYFGGAKETNWNRNRIAVAFAQKRIVVRDHNGGERDIVVRARGPDAAEVTVAGAEGVVEIAVYEPDGDTLVAASQVDLAGGSRRVRLTASGLGSVGEE